MATIITPTGNTVNIKGEGENGELTLKQMQEAVGGLIERVPGGIIDPLTGTQKELLVNEEGVTRGLGFNQKASELKGRLLFGNVLILDKSEWS